MAKKNVEIKRRAAEKRKIEQILKNRVNEEIEA